MLFVSPRGENGADPWDVCSRACFLHGTLSCPRFSLLSFQAPQISHAPLPVVPVPVHFVRILARRLAWALARFGGRLPGEGVSGSVAWRSFPKFGVSERSQGLTRLHPPSPVGGRTFPPLLESHRFKKTRVLFYLHAPTTHSRVNPSPHPAARHRRTHFSRRPPPNHLPSHNGGNQSLASLGSPEINNAGSMMPETGSLREINGRL